MKTPMLIIAAMLLLTTQLRADDQADLQKTAADLDKNAQTSEGRELVLEQISLETKVPVSTLREEQAKTKFGCGELLIANSLATATGKTFGQIAELKASGEGWGQIAHDSNLKLGDIVSKAHHAVDGVAAQSDLQKHAADLDKQAETPDGRERVLEQISQQTKVPVSVLEDQKAKTRLGYGELFIANSLANATGKTFDQIAGLKASGQGWGKIAADNKVNLGDVVSKAKQASDAAQPPSHPEHDASPSHSAPPSHEVPHGGGGGGRGH